MKLFFYLSTAFQSIADCFYAIWPQPYPGKEPLKNCNIISHRGEYDNRDVFENTLPAFDRAYRMGVRGIEFDIRWTKDLHPVVIHDPDLIRVFGMGITVRDIEFDELRSRCPEIPLLSDVIQKYGKKLHLMAEIKAETYPNPDRQNQIFADCFSSLDPQSDYHLMSLTPHMFDLITVIPPAAFIPIAQLNLKTLSNLALQSGFGGVAGHYLLLNQRILASHHKRGQIVGTGYPRSQNCLFREINRGVDWIFSNNAGELQAVLNKLLEPNASGNS